MKLHVICCAIFVSFVLPALAQRSAPIVSPEIKDDHGVSFRIRAPKSQSVALRGQWDRQQVEMTKGEENVWSLTVPNVPAGVWEYSFVVDGLTMIDPANPAQKPQRNPSASILHIPANPPNVWDFQDVPHGTVHQHTYLSKALGKQRGAWIYTPPGYEADTATKYPLFVLQHGSGDRHETWVTHGKAHWILDNLIAAGKAKPMIVLMIDGHPLGMVPREMADKRGESLKAFKCELFEDAIPLVERSYRVSPDREQRAITGLSMGGWQSLSTGMTNLDKFAWIGSFSGAVDENEIKPALDDAAGTNAKLKLLWIACGEKDFLLERNNQLIATLKSRGVNHEWRLTPGDHSWPIWRDYLAEFAPKLFR
ncbi:alpha/beta hydrolase-fold protein [Prosthecobacter sp.]|uniref:alpha/beta hydrolase-fold protein n=1 Tax=Prosthecobacter sp. TaxID=1965333 RepID=UPI00378378FB